jgi:hypothetical protein
MSPHPEFGGPFTLPSAPLLLTHAEATDALWCASRLMKQGVCRGAKPICRESEGVPQI